MAVSNNSSPELGIDTVLRTFLLINNDELMEVFAAATNCIVFKIKLLHTVKLYDPTQKLSTFCQSPEIE